MTSNAIQPGAAWDSGRVKRVGQRLVEIVPPDATVTQPLTLADALHRLHDAEDTLRAIGAGEVDAFVISDEHGRHVFALATADRLYRMFVETMRDGAATVSATGLVLYANQHLADLLSCTREELVGSPLAGYVAGAIPTALQAGGAGWGGATAELDLLGSDGIAVPVLVGASLARNRR